MIDVHNMVKIGSCAVDSGQILIVDPCYVIGDGTEDMRDNKPYEDICSVTLDTSGYAKRAGSVLNDLAVASSTLYGDGRYDVWANVDSDGGVQGLYIDFAGGADLDNDDDNECQRCGEPMNGIDEGDYCWRCDDDEKDDDA